MASVIITVLYSFSLSLSLQTPGSKGYMFKMELQTEAQRLCDKSFSVVRKVSSAAQSVSSYKAGNLT